MDRTEEWWVALTDGSREWLTAHPAEFLPANVANDVVQKGGFVVGAPGWEGDAGSPEVFSLSSDEWDFIKEQANLR